VKSMKFEIYQRLLKYDLKVTIANQTCLSYYYVETKWPLLAKQPERDLLFALLRQEQIDEITRKPDQAQ